MEHNDSDEYDDILYKNPGEDKFFESTNQTTGENQKLI